MSAALRRRCLPALGAMLLAFALPVPVARAGVLVSTATSCEDQTFSQPFVPWLDYASYVLAPDGGLEAAGAGWTLTGAASIGDGNEAFSVRGDGDARHLDVPHGSSATTQAMCVGLEHPTLRLFARRAGGSPLSALRVDVLFEDAAGKVLTLTIGRISAGTVTWQPTAPMPVVANLLPLLPGSHTPVAFRFVAESGDWAVDDVYVDPYARG
jgi:hypothetical protein